MQTNVCKTIDNVLSDNMHNVRHRSYNTVGDVKRRQKDDGSFGRSVRPRLSLRKQVLE